MAISTNSAQDQVKAFLNPYAREIKEFANFYPITATVAAVAASIFTFQCVTTSITLFNILAGTVSTLSVYTLGSHIYKNFEQFVELIVCSIKWNFESEREQALNRSEELIDTIHNNDEEAERGNQSRNVFAPQQHVSLPSIHRTGSAGNGLFPSSSHTEVRGSFPRPLEPQRSMEQGTNNPFRFNAI